MAPDKYLQSIRELRKKIETYELMKKETEEAIDQMRSSIPGKDRVQNSNINGLDIDISRFAYIRIDGKRLANDKSYQSKINEIIHGDKPILIEEKYKHLITGARFVF